MRVFALSDIHVDYEVNEKWVQSLSCVDYLDDILIVAGDVSSSVVRLERCLVEFGRRFKQLLFVPGNHDLWITGKEQSLDSLHKFQRVCEIARRNGASMGPYHAGRLTIVPLLGWYDFSFGFPGVELIQIWTDFHACRWPETWSVGDVTSHFLDMNRYCRRNENEIIISFSHFLPRIDLVADIIKGRHRELFPVLGATRLGEQVRQLRSLIHVYGHSHINRRVSLEATLYVNNAYGYPSESRISAKALKCVYEHR